MWRRGESEAACTIGVLVCGLHSSQIRYSRTFFRLEHDLRKYFQHIFLLNYFLFIVDQVIPKNLNDEQFIFIIYVCVIIFTFLSFT